MKDYTTYKASDFLNDTYFMEWVIGCEDTAQLFWADFIEKYPEKKAEIEKALKILSSVEAKQNIFTDREKQDILENIKHRIKINKSKRQKKHLYYWSSIAATLLIILGVSFIFRFNFIDIADNTTSKPSIVITKQDIQLICNDSNIDISNKYNEQGELILDILAMNIPASKNEWNKLIIPNGRRSYLRLADGSKLHINSGSVVEFPSAFEGRIREIKVAGEIYIEVTKDAKKPFIVTTQDFSVKVHGTSFNVSAYPEEKTQSITLVEGAVEVISAAREPVMMEKSQLCMLREGEIKMLKTVDTSFYTSWIDGVFKFHHEPLSSILNKISRYYNVDIVCSPLAKNINCSGKLVLFEDVLTIIDNISMIVPISYSIENNTIKIDYKPLIQSGDMSE